MKYLLIPLLMFPVAAQAVFVPASYDQEEVAADIKRDAAAMQTVDYIAQAKNQQRAAHAAALHNAARGFIATAEKAVGFDPAVLAQSRIVTQQQMARLAGQLAEYEKQPGADPALTQIMAAQLAAGLFVLTMPTGWDGRRGCYLHSEADTKNADADHAQYLDIVRHVSPASKDNILKAYVTVAVPGSRDINRAFYARMYNAFATSDPTFRVVREAHDAIAQAGIGFPRELTSMVASYLSSDYFSVKELLPFLHTTHPKKLTLRQIDSLEGLQEIAVDATKLIISHNPLKQIPVAAFNPLLNLTTIGAQACQLTRFPLAGLVAIYPELCSIDLTGNQITTANDLGENLETALRQQKARRKTPERSYFYLWLGANPIVGNKVEIERLKTMATNAGYGDDNFTIGFHASR